MSSIGSNFPPPSYASPVSRTESLRPSLAEPEGSDATAIGRSVSTGTDVNAMGLTPGNSGSASPEGAAANEREALARQELSAKEAQLELVEQTEIRELATRDREVRAHEQAHMAVGGQYAGGVSYDYSRGPDGRLYATGGSVSIDISPVAGDPAATISKMQQVQRAALAPAEPSGQDRVVAAQAAQLIAQARSEIASASAGEGGPSTSAERAARADVPETEEALTGTQAAPLGNGIRELATYRQIDAPPASAQEGFRASA